MGRRGHTTTAMRRGSRSQRFVRRLLKTLVVLAVLAGAVYAAGEWMILALDYPYRGPTEDLSGTEDVAMPEDVSRALHEAAGEPKSVAWLELGHVNLGDRELR